MDLWVGNPKFPDIWGHGLSGHFGPKFGHLPGSLLALFSGGLLRPSEALNVDAHTLPSPFTNCSLRSRLFDPPIYGTPATSSDTRSLSRYEPTLVSLLLSAILLTGLSLASDAGMRTFQRSPIIW